MTTENTNTQATTTKEAPKKFVPEFAPVSVKRGKEGEEVEFQFVPSQVKKGDNKGSEYLGPTEIKEDNLDTLIAWMGRKIAAAKLGAFIRQMSQGWFKAAVEESTDEKTKQVDKDKVYEWFTKFASEFSARGESIPALKLEIEELIEEMTSLDIADPDYANKARDIALQVKDLQMSIQSRKRGPRDEANAEATTTA